MGSVGAWASDDVRDLARATWVALNGRAVDRRAALDEIEQIGLLEFDECPYCNGRSTPEYAMNEQLARNGDTSGACDTCNNTQRVLRPRRI